LGPATDAETVRINISVQQSVTVWLIDNGDKLFADDDTAFGAPASTPEPAPAVVYVGKYPETVSFEGVEGETDLPKLVEASARKIQATDSDVSALGAQVSEIKLDLLVTKGELATLQDVVEETNQEAETGGTDMPAASTEVVDKQLSLISENASQMKVMQEQNCELQKRRSLALRRGRSTFCWRSALPGAGWVELASAMCCLRLVSQCYQRHSGRTEPKKWKAAWTTYRSCQKLQPSKTRSI
jgi:hypothetical protein